LLLAKQKKKMSLSRWQESPQMNAKGVSGIAAK
jgi:hypothetical protein